MLRAHTRLPPANNLLVGPDDRTLLLAVRPSVSAVEKHFCSCCKMLLMVCFEAVWQHHYHQAFPRGRHTRPCFLLANMQGWQVTDHTSHPPDMGFASITMKTTYVLQDLTRAWQWPIGKRTVPPQAMADFSTWLPRVGLVMRQHWHLTNSLPCPPGAVFFSLSPFSPPLFFVMTEDTCSDGIGVLQHCSCRSVTTIQNKEVDSSVLSFFIFLYMLLSVFV